MEPLSDRVEDVTEHLRGRPEVAVPYLFGATVRGDVAPQDLDRIRVAARQRLAAGRSHG